MADYVLAVGSSNRPLFQAIADRLERKIVEMAQREGLKVEAVAKRFVRLRAASEGKGDRYDLRIDLDTYTAFADGEHKWEYGRSVTNCHVVIVVATKTAEDWEQLEQMIDAARRGGATLISVVFTYFGTGRQDRKDKPRVCITSAKNLRKIERMGVWRVVLLDPHNTAMQGFIDNPCDILYARPVVVKHLQQYADGSQRSQRPVLYSVDVGGDRIVASYLKRLGWQRGFGFKVRSQANQVEKAVNTGPAKGRLVIFQDDMLDTGNSADAQARYVKKRKAPRVILSATHALLSGTAAARMADSPIDEFVFTNSLYIDPEKIATIERAKKKVTVLDLSDLLASACLACHGVGYSISDLLN